MKLMNDKLECQESGGELKLETKNLSSVTVHYFRWGAQVGFYGIHSELVLTGSWVRGTGHREFRC